MLTISKILFTFLATAPGLILAQAKGPLDNGLAASSLSSDTLEADDSINFTQAARSLVADAAGQPRCPAAAPIKCAGANQCCPTGFPNCCTLTNKCCPTTHNCMTVREPGCCPKVAQTCGGKQCCVTGATCCPAAPDFAGCCPPGGVCCGTKCCQAGTTCCGDRCCKTGTTCRRDSDTRQFVCESPDVKVPLEFDAKKNPELAKNMCRSMRARGINGNEEILRRAKYGTNSDREKAAIRRKAKCGGRTKCCFKRGKGESCDEYPPASTQEGYDGLYGIDVFSQCINAVQNTNGGRQLGALFGKGSSALPAGKSFVVRVTGLDCQTVPPADPGPIQKFPRQAPDVAPAAAKPEPVTGSTTTLYPPLPGDPSSYAILAFGDLDVANYELVVTSNVAINSWEIIDAAALPYSSGTKIAANKATKIKFAVDVKDFGVGMAAFVDKKSFSITWTLTSSPIKKPSDGTD